MASDLQTYLRNLKDRDWSVRNEAIRKLELSGDTRAAPGLIEALGDESQYIRMAAARALGKLRAAEAVPALVKVLDDPVFIVRQSALWSLGEIGPAAKAALPALQKLADDPTLYTERELSVGALAKLAIGRIEAEPEPQAEAAPAGAEQPAAAGEAGTLSPEERKARREAALARKRAKEQGGEGG